MTVVAPAAEQMENDGACQRRLLRRLDNQMHRFVIIPPCSLSVVTNWAVSAIQAFHDGRFP